MKLYDNPHSPNAKRIRVLAAEIGMPIELVNVDFSKGEPYQPPYLEKNPMGKLPTLDDDGYLLWESPAILVYLAAKHPESGLLPAEPRALAETMRWMFWNASHLEPAIFTVVVEKMIKPMFLKQDPDPARIEAGMKDFEKYAPVLGRHLEGREWVSDRFSIADIAIGTSVEMGGRVGVELTKHPSIAGWFERLTSRDAWKRA